MLINHENGTYRTYAYVVTPEGERIPVTALRRPGIAEMRLLYVLCEHVCRILDIDEVCDRLEMSENAVRVTATRLRQKLHPDWVIENGIVSRRGIRIIYAVHPISKMPKTKLEAVPRRKSKAALKQQSYRARWQREREAEEQEIAGV